MQTGWEIGMAHWMVRGRDEELGVYEGATKADAIAAMRVLAK